MTCQPSSTSQHQYQLQYQLHNANPQPTRQHVSTSLTTIDFFRYNSKPNNNKPCIHLLITSLVPPSTASLPSYKMFQQQTARGGGSGFDGSHHQPSTMGPKDPYEGMSQIERF